MTKQEAKEITLEVWQYLADHPEIDDKKRLPGYLYRKVKSFLNLCPLCELFMDSSLGVSECTGCPLDSCARGSFYAKWNLVYIWDKNPKAMRKEAAQEIINKVKAWEVKEEE